MAVTAVKHIRAMRGGSQPHLMQADDKHFYVVKFLNNAQHHRVLANEWLAARLGSALGLPMPAAVQIEVPATLVSSSPGLTVTMRGRALPCASGLSFGSRVPVSRLGRPVYDYLPGTGPAVVENLADFAGMLVFDTWLCNCDQRQVIFCRPGGSGRLKAFMVDNGACFDTGRWCFPDSPRHGVYPIASVYSGVSGWSSFEPWLGRVESYNEGAICALAAEIPDVWCGDRYELERLLACLVRRRARVRELLWAIHSSPGSPFHNWGPGVARFVVVA